MKHMAAEGRFSLYSQVEIDLQSRIVCLTINLHLYDYLRPLKTFSYVIRNTQLSPSYRLLNDVTSLMIASLTLRHS